MNDQDFKIRVSQVKAANGLHGVARRLGLLKGVGDRYFCPLCQPGGPMSHRTPDLAIYDDTTFHCFKCGNGGDVIVMVQSTLSIGFTEALSWLEGKASDLPGRFKSSSAKIFNAPPHKGLLSEPGNGGLNRLNSQPPAMASNINRGDSRAISLRQNLAANLSAFQISLPGSIGEQYLEKRGIDLKTAQCLGVGYASPGAWPGRPSPEGRLVFPHSDPDGRVVNLYGRAVEVGTTCPRHLRHDHLPLPKAIFNTASLSRPEITLVEGPFCALTLYQLGTTAVAATFGVNGLRWDWVRSRRIILAFDRDQAGIINSRRLALEGLIRGIRVQYLADSEFLGQKDLNEALLSDLKPSTSSPTSCR